MKFSKHVDNFCIDIFGALLYLELQNLSDIYPKSP